MLYKLSGIDDGELVILWPHNENRRNRNRRPQWRGSMSLQNVKSTYREIENIAAVEKR